MSHDDTEGVEEARRHSILLNMYERKVLHMDFIRKPLSQRQLNLIEKSIYRGNNRSKDDARRLSPKEVRKLESGREYVEGFCPQEVVEHYGVSKQKASADFKELRLQHLIMPAPKTKYLTPRTTRRGSVEKFMRRPYMITREGIAHVRAKRLERALMSFVRWSEEVSLTQPEIVSKAMLRVEKLVQSAYDEAEGLESSSHNG